MEKRSIDCQTSKFNKNRDDENDNELTLVAHEFDINGEASYHYI